MKVKSLTLTTFLLLATHITASSWLSKAAYNYWHETELQRWLCDHGVPYSEPADRKELEELVKDNWDQKVLSPMANGRDKVYGTVDNVKDWAFESWNDLQLRGFLERHGISTSKMMTRRSLLNAVRSNYASIAKASSQTLHYPGKWLYAHWSDSDLKDYLDRRGIEVPQTSTRDELISQVRRASHVGINNAKEKASDASAAAKHAQDRVSDEVLNTWSDTELKSYLDKHGVRVPQGSRRNELVALARRNSHLFTTSAKHAASDATNAAKNAQQRMSDQMLNTWSDTELKSYLDKHGVRVPQGSRRNELVALARRNSHLFTTSAKHAASDATNAAKNAQQRISDEILDTWSDTELKSYFDKHGIKVPQGSKRNQLVALARRNSHLFTTSALHASEQAKERAYDAAAAAKHAQHRATDEMFNAWSDTELKNFFDKHGIKIPQGTKRNELIALARRYRHLYATTARHASEEAKQTAASKFGYPTEQQGIFSTVYEYSRPVAGWFWSHIKDGSCAIYGHFSSVAHNDTTATKKAQEQMHFEL